jgi:pimeloyl-ACP methyl ester carboxylesterase
VAVKGWELTDTVDTRLGEVRWSRFGAPDGDPVVLLHGTPFSSDVWGDVARGLAHRHRVHVWDMPGYGTSARFDGQDLSLPALTEVFVELLDHWQLTEASVVAHDSGGAIALGAHLEHRVRYRRLVLVDAVALSPWGSPFGDLAGAYAEVFARLDPELHEALLRTYVSSASGRRLRPPTLDALVAPWLGPDGQAAFYRQLAQRRHDQAYTDRLQATYQSVYAPVLLCWGAEDRWVPADRGRELADRIPGSRLEILEDAGHLLPQDRPAELTALLLPFLSERP